MVTMPAIKRKSAENETFKEIFDQCTGNYSCGGKSAAVVGRLLSQLGCLLHNSVILVGKSCYRILQHPENSNCQSKAPCRAHIQIISHTLFRGSLRRIYGSSWVLCFGLCKN